MATIKDILKSKKKPKKIVELLAEKLKSDDKAIDEYGIEAFLEGKKYW